MKSKNLVQRGRIWYLVRRVPKRYNEVEKRGQIWLSLGTDSHDEAVRRCDGVWDNQIEAWELMIAGKQGEAQERFDAAREIAKRRGFKYIPAAEIAKLPVDEIIDRVEAATDHNNEPEPAIAIGTMGGAKKPKITVSEALELYWGLAADRTLSKSKDQIRRWKNPRMKAVSNFISVNGDILIEQITADEMQEFRDFWLDRVRAGTVTAETANKDFTHFGDVIKTVNQGKRLRLDLPLSGWSLKAGEKGQRAAFSTQWIKDHFLVPGSLAGLNGEARDLLLAMVNTGARPSEIACLGRDQIKLEANIPHISIEPVGRILKSQYAKRKIPLLGVSLEAFRRRPDGFPRYADSADPTAGINKYLAENNLKEIKGRNGTTAYSLRHSFQERMIAAGVDDRLRRELFGHTLTEERYGNPGLDVLQKALQPVAL